jgi:ketosteroid isomerase-like protein
MSCTGSSFSRVQRPAAWRALVFACAVLAPYAIGRAAPTEVPAPAPADVMAGDREFAQFALDAGIRAAYDRYLAADAIVFRPLPVTAREWLDTHEPATGRLEWSPAAALTACDASLAVTLGTWTYTARDSRTSDTGYYLTAWRRGEEGDWRIVLDQSLSLHGLPALPAASGVCTGAPAVADELRSADRRANSGVRNLRVNSQPAIAVRAETMGMVTGSVHADLGLTHGQFIGRKAARGAQPEVRAVYVRLWQRQGRTWRLLQDFTSTVTP